jgi:NTP pyrophosphatase (non-canonical NTP hydrolase)
METSSSQIEKHYEILRIAEELYQKNPDWVTYYRELLGVDGLVRQTFLTQNQLDDFEQSEAYREIHYLLTKLRQKHFANRNKPKDEKNEKEDMATQKTDEADEDIQVITVRIPKSIHETLTEEAYQCRTSVNQLCISKLIQFIDTEMVPSDKKR